MNKFTARIYTSTTYRSDLWFFITNVPGFAGAFRQKRVGRAFAERIMLVVTTVNGCRYCAWFHAWRAGQAGMTEAEIKEILALQFQVSAPESEIAALLYAQHFAETGGNPDRDVSERLIQQYGADTARDIDFYVRAIYLGNLVGNTYDAFFSRLRGRKADGSSALFEFFIFVTHFPLYFPLSYLVKDNR